MAERQQDPKAGYSAAAADAEAVQVWHAYNRPNAAEAAAWFNQPPAQQAGQAIASNRSDGTVDVYGFW